MWYIVYVPSLALLQYGAKGGGGGGMAPSLSSCFSAVSMSWFTFAIASILCCGPPHLFTASNAPVYHGCCIDFVLFFVVFFVYVASCNHAQERSLLTI